MKNPFKKTALIDTLTNVGIGGAANVAIDYGWDAAGLDATIANMIPSVEAGTIKNAIKILGGALVGGMVKNKYARAAADGVAVVGASNLISGLITGSEDSKGGEGASGLPEGTIGSIRRMGQRGFARRARVAGVQGAAFMAD